MQPTIFLSIILKGGLTNEKQAQEIGNRSRTGIVDGEFSRNRSSNPSAQSNRHQQGTSGLTPGLLAFYSVPSDINFNTTLSGDEQTIKADLDPIIAYDATGTGAGWKISVEAKQFTEDTPASGFKPGTTARTLPLGSLSLTAPSTIIAAAVAGGKITTSPLPNLVAPATAAIDNGSSVKIVSADPNKGMGGYQIKFPSNALALTLNPATTYTDSVNYPSTATPYTSALTWTLSVGP